MKTQLSIFSILLATTVLTGCSCDLFKGCRVTVVDDFKHNSTITEIKTGDLETSKKYVAGNGELYLHDEIIHLAAENVLKAYQNDSKLGLDKLYYLVSAHDTLIKKIEKLDKENKNYNSPERLKHIKAIVLLAQHQALRDYAYDENFRQQENSKGYDAHIKFYIIQLKIYNAIANLLVNEHSVSVSGDPYRPFQCTQSVQYQKEIDLINVRFNTSCNSSSCGQSSLNSNWGLYYPCKNTSSLWRDSCEGYYKNPEKQKASYSPCKTASARWELIVINEIKHRIKKGSLAEAERCVIECEIERKNAEFPLTVRGARRFAAEYVIEAYKNIPEHQQKLREKSYALICFGSQGIEQEDAEAEKWIRKAAEQGDAFVQYSLGAMYAEGRGVTENKAEAAKWYRKAAAQGHKDAQYSLGTMYFHGQGVARDDAEAAKWLRKAIEQGHVSASGKLRHLEDVKRLRKAAEQGDAFAQFNLGLQYEADWGITKNEAEAVKWYRKAAEQGNAAAQFGLGTMYFHGRGVARDSAEAMKWYRKAAAQGYEYAQRALNDAEAVKQLRKVAEQGDAQSQYLVGLDYISGNRVAKDDAEGKKWLRKAAEQGHKKAQDALNDTETNERLRRAAEQGDAQAQYGLGFKYYRGSIKAKDGAKPYAEAMEWFHKAAKQGNAEAQYHLGFMYIKEWGVERDAAKAVKWYHKAAEQGHAQAQYNLGEIYRTGWDIITKDEAKAAKWYRKAAEQGHAEAQRTLGLMYSYGEGVAQDNAEADKWSRKAREQQ